MSFISPITDSAYLTFLQAGTGAVTRSVQSKLRDVVSVKDFGAVGDGVTDDTAAIQAAINAAPTYGAVFFPSGNYIVGATITIVKDDIAIVGSGARITAKSSTNFEYVFYGTGRSRVTVAGLRIDANKAGRSSGQTIRFMGIGFEDSTDICIENCYVENALGYSSIPGVGIAIGGALSARCRIANCTLMNCGGTLGTDAADGIFLCADNSLITGCIARNCTDTAFVIESCNGSGIVGCTAISCNAIAGITNAVNADKYGNFVSGLTGIDWNSSVTGGIQIGCPLSTSTGNLDDTTISDVTLVATAPKGTGPAINIRKTGTPKTRRLTLNNIRIRYASTQGILVDGDDVSIRGCDISNTGATGIQINPGSLRAFIAGCSVNGGTFGIASGGSATVVAEANYCQSQTSWGIYAFDTSTITSMFNVVKNPGVNFIGKDGGATLELVGSQGNALAVNNAAGAATTGSIVDKFVISDRNGAPLGYIPIYNI